MERENYWNKFKLPKTFDSTAKSALSLRLNKYTTYLLTAPAVSPNDGPSLVFFIFNSDSQQVKILTVFKLPEWCFYVILLTDPGSAYLLIYYFNC